MAGFRISTRNVKNNAARKAARRGANIRPALLKIGGAMRDSIREEFKLQGWRRPRGGLTRWLPVESFGTRPPPSRVLHRSGNLLRGWTQLTSQKVTGRTVQITNPLIYAKVHRGSDASGRVSSTNKTDIPVTEKMRVFLGMKFGRLTQS